MVDSSDKRDHVYRRNRERFSDACVRVVDRWGRASTMIWAWISLRGKTYDYPDSPDYGNQLGDSPISQADEYIEIDWEEEFDRGKMREYILSDPILKKVQEWKERDKKPEWCEIADQWAEAKYFLHRWELLEM